MIKYIVPEDIEDKQKLMADYGVDNNECATLKFLNQSKVSGEFKVLALPTGEQTYSLEGLETITLTEGEER